MNKMEKQISIRDAQQTDIPTIMELIQLKAELMVVLNL